MSDKQNLDNNRNKKAIPLGENLGAAGFAVIFDMDGTLVDNTPFHYKAWQLLFKSMGRPELTKQTYLAGISGVPILNTVKRYFGDTHDEAGLIKIVEQRQELYRQEFLPYLRPINGLENFLIELKDAGVKMAVATSSDKADVDFIFDTIPIRRYFNAIITGGMVSKPKPHPQIFLKAAEQLNASPDKCVVFEDSTSGLQAGNSAGMKVVGITTAHPAGVIAPMASLVIDDYAGMSVQKLAGLFKEKTYER